MGKLGKSFKNFGFWLQNIRSTVRREGESFEDANRYCTSVYPSGGLVENRRSMPLFSDLLYSSTGPLYFVTLQNTVLQVDFPERTNSTSMDLTVNCSLHTSRLGK